MNKILSLITMMVFVMILVSCTSSSLEDFTVYFYHPGDSAVVLKVDQDNEITMSSHDREGWYYATFKVESIDNLDLSLEFAVGLEKVQFELITKTAIYFSLNGQFTSFEEAEASGLDDAKTRVYFLNTNGWMQVYAYVFYGEPTSEAMGSWPGTPAVIDVDDLGSGWYYIDVELDVNS